MSAAKESKKQLDMTESSHSELWVMWMFALPLIASNLFHQFYSLTDAAVIGNFTGIAGLAAVSCTGWFTWLTIAIARDYSNAVSIVASVSFGNQDKKRLREIAATTFTFGIILALVLTALMILGIDEILYFFNVNSEILKEAKTYLFIVNLGFLATMVFYVAGALIRAVGNSRSTFVAVTTSTCVNIGLDLLFVIVFRMGVLGAALATVIAQVVSAGILLINLLRNDVYKGAFHFAVDMSIIKEILSLSLPMLLNSLVISLGGILVERAVNGIGTYFTAGISAGSKIFSLMESIYMALVSALSVFVGQNMGAEKIARIRSGVRKMVWCGLVMAATLNVFVALFAGKILNLFLSSDNYEVYLESFRVAKNSISITTYALFIMAPMYLYRIAVQTMKHPMYATIAGVLQMVVRVLCITVVPLLIGEWAYYIPTVLAWTVSLPIVYFPYRFYIKKMEERTEETPAAD